MIIYTYIYIYELVSDCDCVLEKYITDIKKQVLI